MTGEDAPAPDRPYTLREADEACLGRGPCADGPPGLTLEDAVLLFLLAGPGPVRGKRGRVRRALLAAARALRGSGLEPALFRGGRGGPSAAQIDDAVGQLEFSGRVRASGGGAGGAGGRDIAVEITPRGADGIREKHESLPHAARKKLEVIRAKLDAPPRPQPAAAKGGAGAGAGSGALLKGGTREDGDAGGPAGSEAAEGRPGRGEDAAKFQKYVDRGDRLLEEGRHDEAYANYRLAARLRAPGAGLRLRMARSMAEMGLYEDALKNCRAAIRDEPAGAGGYSAAGHCLDSLGRHAEALPYHQRAAGLDPGSAAAHQGALFSLFRLGRHAEALRHAEILAGMQPKDSAAHARVAACLSRLGRHEEAASAGRRAIEAAPSLAASYFPLLAALLELGRHEEVLEWCGEAAKADALDPRPRFITALSLHALGRREEALAHCKKAVELDPANPDFRGAMSMLLRELRRLPEALSHCEAAASARPGSLPLLSNMGSMLAELCRHKEALECLGRAIRLDPDQPVPRYNRGLSLQKTGRPRRALREYERVVALDPGHIGAYNNAGTVLSGLGRDGEALAYFDRALELDPASAAVHGNKALSLQRLGLHKNALAYFDRALELDPASAIARIGRATCLAKLGLPDEKIGHYAGDKMDPATTAGGAGHSAAGRHAADAPPLPAPAQEAASGGDRARLVKSLLSRDESKTLEFKSWPASRPGVPPDSSGMEGKIARELCSLANTEGGDLLIGVGDGGEVEGLAPGGGRLPRKERDKMLSWLANVIADYLGAERGNHFDFEIVEVDGLDILHCAVPASEDGPVIVRKRLEGRHDFFVRVGSTCRPLDSREMLEYVKTKWHDQISRPRPMGQSTAGQSNHNFYAAVRDLLASAVRALVENVPTTGGS